MLTIISSMHIYLPPMNSRQIRFAEQYALFGNASEAARAAGYAPASAKVTACRLVTNDNVASAVRAARRELEARMDVSRARGMHCADCRPAVGVESAALRGIRAPDA